MSQQRQFWKHEHPVWTAIHNTFSGRQHNKTRNQLMVYWLKTGSFDGCSTEVTCAINDDFRQRLANLRKLAKKD